MASLERIAAKRRALALIEHNSPGALDRDERRAVAEQPEAEGRVRTYLSQAGLSFHPIVLFLFMALGATVVSLFATTFLSVWFTPLFFLSGAMIPLALVERRVRDRANQFSADYPTVLLATASSIKAGMTAYRALERSIRLLPEDSLVRSEVRNLLAALDKGTPREQAVSRFARGIRQPDVELFRTAFSLASEHGGKFGPTLERLARVCRDRGTLTHMAGVRTATMRMTANVLLALTPVIVMMIAVRTDGYWDLFLNDPTANTLSTAGILCILISYATLIRMSNFRP